MENTTIYSHALAFDKIVKIVKAELPKAKIDIQDNGGLQKSLVVIIKGGFFGKFKKLTLNYRERLNPDYRLENIECGLTQNLAGMANFIAALPAKNPEIKSKFMTAVLSANSETAFIAEPGIREFATVLRKITQETNAFLFAQPNSFFRAAAGQYFVDKNFNLILDTAGNCAVQDLDVKVDAKYHDAPAENNTPAQLKRKAESEAYLTKNQIKINKNLPCVADVSDIKLRTRQEVIDRAYALLLTAVKGEGVEQENLNRAAAEKRIDSLSPREKHIFSAAELTDQERAYATWRYESLNVILWALGKTEDLKYPSEICDVSFLVRQIFKPTREDFVNSVTLKSVKEITDELDKIYRMNWACVNARIKGETPTGNLNPSVVYERHYTLNWLTGYQNAAWDEVRTDT